MNLPLIAIPNFEKLTPEEIVRLPDEVRRRARDAIVPALTGTCAVLSYIDGDDLYVAHAGDSRAILGVQTPTGLQALELTRDHQPSNPDELARLKQEHPGEENTVAYRRGNAGPLRVIGGMMPTRAFGDAKFKWPLEWHAKVDALLASVHPPHKHVFTTSKHCFTPPYMTARPDIVHRHLTEEDSFIVLASDGIFDYLSNDDVVGAVDQYLQAALTSSILSSPSTVLLPVVRDTNAATHVVRTALSHGKGDKEAARMLSLSSDERRNWRDDMTVVVIFLRGSAVTQASSAGIPAVSSATVASTSKEMGKVEGAGGLEAVVDVNVDFGIPRVVEHLGNEKVVVGEHLQGR
ncbi:phosphatase 2C-like domain-containing protein [Cladochytrium replicatum]|nr:phosphatase 2C-like domain-containing protein [Cladochytrium replicatum]